MPKPRRPRLGSTRGEHELELELVPDGNVVGAKQGDFGFQPAAFDDRVAMHGDPVPAATLVEAERVEVVVGGDEPDAPAADLLVLRASPINQRGAGAPSFLEALENDDLGIVVVEAQ